MAIFSNAVTLTGAATDDYMLGDFATSAHNTMFGGAGRDVMIGDSDNVLLVATAGTGFGNAYSLTSDLTIWSQLYNPDIANSTTVSHATAVIEGNNTSQFYRVTLAVGQILTLDVDYGTDANGTVLGNVDTELHVYAADQTTVVATNNTGLTTEGGLGSNSTLDGFVTFTATVAGDYYIRVQESGNSLVDTGDNYMLNISLTNQPSSQPSTGNDDLFGGDGNDVMYGIGGNDKLYGGNDNDYMTGDTGNDTLDGGAGVDLMYGGDNNDTFIVANGFAVTNGDEIYGGAGIDTLNISALTGLTGVSVNLTAGTFTHSGSTSINVIAEVENVVGTTGDDNFVGNASVNVFTGGLGNDTFEGGLGTDSFIGGQGNDTYFTNSTSEGVVEVSGEGTNDVVIASSTYTLTAESEVEVIQTSNAAGTTGINLTGNALAQSIIGNAGNNALTDGVAGAADTLTGNAGNDTYYVNTAGTLIVEGSGQGTNDRVAASVNFTLAADDNIENLTTNIGTGTTAINLTGNALSQTITGNNGNNVLDSFTGAADTMSGALGNDTYIIRNAGDVIVEAAGQGTADVVSAAVSFVLDVSDDIETLQTVSFGGTAAINLTGNALGQTIIGNAGANVLDGKGGNDTLTGSAGADTYAFSSALGGSNIDTVSGYVVADDTIRLDNNVFTGLTFGALASTAFVQVTSGGATTADQRIIYNSVTGALSFDADGSGAGLAQQFATLATGLTMAHTEFDVVGLGGGGGSVINGTINNDNLVGTGVADTLNGLAGDDTLSGGLGNDVNFGGTGNDTFVVESSGDIVNELAGEGTNDKVVAQGSYTLIAGSAVETLQTSSFGGTAAINLTGNALAQSIIGNAGNNSLDDGGAGAADTMTGSTGNDTYYVSNAGTVIVEGAGQGTNDRVAASVSFVLAADDDIESLTTNVGTGTTAINLTGNALSQSISGNNGNNVLDSFTGAADTLSGALGNDTYIIRNAGDVIVEAAGQGTADVVSAAVSFVLDVSDDIETMQTVSFGGTAAINLTGNALGQTIIGNAGANVLDGKGGNDTLTGSAGADIYAFSTALGASNIDVVSGYVVADDMIRLDNNVFAGLTFGALASTAFVQVTSGGATTADQRIIYNSVTGALSFDADGSGAGLAQQFATLATGLTMAHTEFDVVGLGGGGGSVINGTINNDNLVGTGVADTLNGLAGDDTLSGGLGNDINFGGTGNDTFVVESSGDIVNELVGEGTNDKVVAQGTYVLVAGSEVETMQTSSFGGTAAINLTGNALAQTIIGNAGNNTLDDGGAGAADTLTGSIGNDTYYVSNAGTVIVEGAGQGTNDRVATRVSFTLAADDNIESLTTIASGSTTAINLTGNALSQSIMGNAGANVLDSFTGAADTLTGLGGNDTYIIRNSGDVIVEAAGQGTADVVSAAVSFVLDASDDIETLQTNDALGTTDINLTGNALGQTIIGNNGINVIDGKGGNDILTDGNGLDTFVFSTALDAVNNVDTLTEYDSGTDILALTSSLFGVLAGTVTALDFVANATGEAEAAEQNLIYNTTTGALSYDDDGVGGNTAVQFATLTGAAFLQFTDFVIV